MEGSSEVSGSGITPGTLTPDHQGPNLPGYFPYLSLVFKWIATLIILMMAGWVVFTIKTTRKLRKPHNIFVANLMITDTISAVLNTILTSIMMIGYATGLGDFINCRIYVFSIFVVVLVLYSAYLLISANQVIAIAFPYRHRRVMKCRVIISSITAAWLLAILFQVHVFFNPGYVKVAQHGRCIAGTETTFILTILTTALLIFTISLSVVVLNAYLAFKAYQVQRQIQEKLKLSGITSNEVNNLKKQTTTKTHLKPMITLLVVVLGSSAVGLLLPLLYIPVIALDAPAVYKNLLRYVIDPNLTYLVHLLHPFVYGLYYKQVHEPMMKVLKSVTCRNKFNSAVVAPQPRRAA